MKCESRIIYSQHSNKDSQHSNYIFMKKGFTLIELLVVIAIIGILASVVLVSFPGATKKAKDARVISAISQARTVMVYMQANEGNYNNWHDGCTISGTTCTCTNAPDVKLLCEEALKNGGTWVMKGYDGADAGTDKEDACMYSSLNIGGYYCADSSGVAGRTTTNPATADCNGTSNAKCPSLVGE